MSPLVVLTQLHVAVPGAISRCVLIVTLSMQRANEELHDVGFFGMIYRSRLRRSVENGLDTSTEYKIVSP